MRAIPLTKGKYALVDDEDYALVSPYKWHAVGKGRAGNLYYARTVQGGRSGQSVSLHRFILQPEPHEVVDHINHNGLDCRRSNMRVVSQRENILNSRKHAKSGNRFKGVYITRWGTFRVTMTTEHGYKDFGHHKSETFAARVYDAVVTRLRGEFAHTNFPDIDPEADAIAARLIEAKGLAA